MNTESPRAHPNRIGSGIVSYRRLGIVCALCLLGCDALRGCNRGEKNTGTVEKIEEVQLPPWAKPDASSAEPKQSMALPPPAATGFFDTPDEPIRTTLAEAEIVSVERGRGGRSLSFKLQFKDGTEGYFKPEQTFSAANWYSEVAAYYLDRELGFGRVPPVIGRKIPWETLKKAAGSDDRKDELILGEDGTLRGAVIWWIDTPLARLDTPRGWEDWIRVANYPSSTVTPFQRARRFVDALDVKKEGGDPYEYWPPLRRDIEPDRADRPKELSDLIVFDYLINNMDRWGGDNINIRTLGNHGLLVFLDNGAGFSRSRAFSGIMESRLHVVQRFVRKTIDAVRELDMRQLKRRIATDPLAPVLNKEDFERFEKRRARLLEYVDTMHERYGDEIYW